MRDLQYLSWGTAACFICMGATAQAQFVVTPAWAYQVLEELGAQGYVLLPQCDLHTLSREQLAALVAEALQEVESRAQAESLSQPAERGQVAIPVSTALPASADGKGDARAVARARKDSLKAVEKCERQAFRGESRLEIMQPLQKKADACQQALIEASRAYALQQAVSQPPSEEITRLAGEFARQNALLVEDEVHLRLAQEQLRTADKSFGRAARHKGDDAKAYELAAREYTLAHLMLQRRSAKMARMLERQGELLAAIRQQPNAMPARQLLGADQSAMAQADRLRAEFITELQALGYLADESAQQAGGPPVKPPMDPRFKVDVEARLDGGNSSGEEGRGSHFRGRLRVFPDYNIDGNWHAKGMLEYEHFFTGREEKDKVRFDRYYLEGDLGIFHTWAGAFGSTMAEGNIYDSKFTGARFSTQGPVRYQLEYGKLNNDVRALDFTASYDTPTYGIDGGFYTFAKLQGVRRNIFMLNYRRPLGKFDLGAMLLYGLDRKAGNGLGYVLTLSQGKLNSWQAGNQSWWLKYYYQPSSTYVQHTMNGMADYMSHDARPDRGGFRGVGVGYAYTLRKDLVLAIEAYRLQDLWTKEYSNTIWASLTAYWKNYEE